MATLKEAIKSGKKFKLPGDGAIWLSCDQWTFFEASTGDNLHITPYDAVRDDWEIEEPEVKLTKTKFIEKWAESLEEVVEEQGNIYLGVSTKDYLVMQKSVQKLLKKLGFEE